MLKTLCGLLIVSGAFGTPATAQISHTPGGPLALVGGTIYVSPTENPIRDGVILIQDGTIAAVGTRASVRIPRGIQPIDCSAPWSSGAASRVS